MAPATINRNRAAQSIITTLLISELSPLDDQVNNKNETTLIKPIAIANGWNSLLKTESKRNIPMIANRTARWRSSISVFESWIETPYSLDSESEPKTPTTGKR